MLCSDSVFVSKFIKLFDGFNFYFILFVPFTINEKPSTLYEKSFKYLFGKGISICCGVNS